MRSINVLGRIAILVVGLIIFVVMVAMLVYPPLYVYRASVWQTSDAFDWQKFPSHPLNAAPTAYHFETALDPRVEELFEEVSGAEDWEASWKRMTSRNL